MYVPSRKAVDLLGLHPNTLRRYADNGKIEYIRNEAGQRLYNVQSYRQSRSSEITTICYCRVSSRKQKDDLARQILFMQDQFPKATIISDIGSGLNFKRKGLRTILDKLMWGDKLNIIVSHRDRLTRFGFDLIKYLVEQNDGQLMVLDKSEHSPESELTADLHSILHVFSCRMHGLRRYTKQIKEDKDLPNH